MPHWNLAYLRSPKRSSSFKGYVIFWQDQTSDDKKTKHEASSLMSKEPWLQKTSHRVQKL